MTTIGSGTRIKSTLNAFVGEYESIVPRDDRIIVEPLQWNPSTILQVEWHGEPLRGRVLAAGPGKYITQYASGQPPVWHPTWHPPAKGKRTASRESKIFQKMTLKVGDLVQFGGLEIRGFLHKTFMWGSRQVILCQEQDVTFIEEREAA